MRASFNLFTISFFYLCCAADSFSSLAKTSSIYFNFLFIFSISWFILAIFALFSSIAFFSFLISFSIDDFNCFSRLISFWHAVKSFLAFDRRSLHFSICAITLFFSLSSFLILLIRSLIFPYNSATMVPSHSFFKAYSLSLAWEIWACILRLFFFSSTIARSVAFFLDSSSLIFFLSSSISWA